MLSILDLKPLPDEKSSSTAQATPPAPAPIDATPMPARKTPAAEEAASTAANMGLKATAQPIVIVQLPESPAPAALPKAAAPSPVVQAPSSPPQATPMKKTVRRALGGGEIPVSEPVNIPEEPRAQPGEQASKKDAAEKEADAKQKEEQGEFEIVLGRRQIATWLFIGTLLIAGFSATSYYVGRMSVANPLAELEGKSEPYVASATPYSAPNFAQDGSTNALVSSAPNAGRALPEATILRPGEPASLSPTITATTAPAASSVRSAPVVTPAPQVQTAPSQPAPAAPPQAQDAAGNLREWNAAAASPVPNDPPMFAAPQPGALYLQMGAVDKGMAVVLAEGLRRHGFHSFVAPGPSEKIFRVLIGPFARQEDYKQAKAEVDAIDLGTFARRFSK